MKKWHASKTIRANIAILIVSLVKIALDIASQQGISLSPEMVGLLMSMLGIILRLITDEPIQI